MNTYSYTVGLFLLALFGSSIYVHQAYAQMTKVVYESDFSTDPAWNTDQPENFYWQASTSALYAHAENAPTGENPSRYLVTETTLDPAESFVLTADIQVLKYDQNGTAIFGLFADDLEAFNQYTVGGVLSEGTVNAEFLSINNNTGFWEFNIVDKDQINRGGGGSSSLYLELKTWYEIRIAYDAAIGEIHLIITNKSTGGIYRESIKQAVYFAPEMQNLGISVHPQGKYNTVLSDPARIDGSSDFLIDNVRLEQILPEPEPLSDLLLQYEPVLYFHPDEDYFPMNVEAFVEGSGLWDSTLIDKNLVPRGDGNILSLDYLATTTDTTNWYLAYSNDEAGTIDLAEAKRRYDEATSTDTAVPTYYAYEMDDEYEDEFGVVHRFKVLQYWYFYAMNNWSEHQDLGNSHEGDWESVFVFLDADTEEPMHVAFSAHHNDGDPSNPLQYASVRRGWDAENILFDNGQVISFVSAGSHANYPTNGSDGIHTVTPLITDDLTSTLGNKFREENWLKRIPVSTLAPDWFVDYVGRWGANKLNDLLNGNSGPQGPLYSDVSGIVRFENPIEWAGIDRLSELVVDEPTDTLTFNQSDITMQFAQALENGTIVTVDPHDEFINFGVNIAEIDLLPHYYDFGTSLADGTFEVHVTLTYTDEELEALELSEDALTIYYYNDVTDIWEVVDAAVDTVLNTLTFTTNHFSVYAIGVVEQTEEQTLEELYEQLRTTISDTELRRLYKKLLIRQVVLSKRFAEREHPVSIKIAKKLLENVQRRITRYERRGLLTEDEKNKIEVDVNKVLEKLNFEIT